MKEVILCVDDEAVILLAMKFLLKNALGTSYLIECASRAGEALEIMSELKEKGFTVRLLITDWLMPGLKGDDLLRTARGIQPGLRSIMITGQAKQKVLDDLIAEGLVDSVFYKPWNEEAFMRTVKDCLETS
jgi:DNA-binding NtrC family response regulator